VKVEFILPPDLNMLGGISMAARPTGKLGTDVLEPVIAGGVHLALQEYKKRQSKLLGRNGMKRFFLTF